MGQGILSTNALILSLKKLGWGVVLLVCTTRVYHFMEGIVFPFTLSKCVIVILCKSPSWVTNYGNDI